MFFVAQLFVLTVTLFIGQAVAARVPDEITPSRRYLQLGPDFLLLLMTGIFLAGFGWGWYTLAALVLLIAARMLIPFQRAYAPVSGAILGAGLFLQNEVFGVLLLLCLVLNYVTGLLLETRKDAVVRALTQPAIAGVAVLAIWFLI